MSGQMNHSAALIIQSLLIDHGGIVTDPSEDAEWPCYVNMMFDSPDNAVAVRDTAGVGQGRTSFNDFVEKHGIQISVRGNGPVDGYVKAARIQQVLNSVHRREVAVMEETGTATTLYRVHTLQPTTPVVRAGPYQNSRRYLWTINFLVDVSML